MRRPTASRSSCLMRISLGPSLSAGSSPRAIHRRMVLVETALSSAACLMVRVCKGWPFHDERHRQGPALLAQGNTEHRQSYTTVISCARGDLGGYTFPRNP